MALNARMGGRKSYSTGADGHAWGVLIMRYARRESGAPGGSAAS